MAAVAATAVPLDADVVLRVGDAPAVVDIQEEIDYWGQKATAEGC